MKLNKLWKGKDKDKAFNKKIRFKTTEVLRFMKDIIKEIEKDKFSGLVLITDKVTRKSVIFSVRDDVMCYDYASKALLEDMYLKYGNIIQSTNPGLAMAMEDQLYLKKTKDKKKERASYIG